jgi:hypothetical protein
VKDNRVLRVALVWQGTVMQEKTFRLPSDAARVTIGESRSNTFILSGSGVPETHELFHKDSDGYQLDIPKGATGRVTMQEQEQPVDKLAGRTVHVVPGDWGVIHYGSVTFFFQFVADDAHTDKFGIIASLLTSGTLATAIWFSALLQIVFVFVARLLWDQELERQQYTLDDRFVQIIGTAPPDEVVDVQEEEATDETTSQRAGGEEGQFGEEDAQQDESILPDHDGPMVDHLDDTELGRAFEAAIAQSGALSRMFDPNSLDYGLGQDYATAGEGDAFVIGRGSGGLGIRGTGRGGGGQGFGRAHGVGNIDTGGGRGVSANLGRRGQRTPHARVDRGEATINGFLSRDQIERVVRMHTRGIRYCYERELMDDPTLEGQITVNWTIDLDGRVSRRSVESNTMGNRDVESCLLREVGRMRFPEPDGGMVVVRYPFTFHGADNNGGGGGGGGQ